MGNDVTVQIKSELSRLADEKKYEWVLCPSCGEEWSKLRPCLYMDWFTVDKEHRQKETNVCVQCAETLKAWDWVVASNPIRKPFENWGDDWLKMIPIWSRSIPSKLKTPSGEEVIMWGSKSILLLAWAGEPTGDPLVKWIFTTSGQKILKIEQKGERTVLADYENVFQAWFATQFVLRKLMKEKQETKSKGDEIQKGIWSDKKGFKKL